MYAYKNVETNCYFNVLIPWALWEVRAKDTQDGCDYVIYWYVDKIAKDNKKIKIIQVWDKDQTHFYVQEEDGKLEKDESQKINPRPHTLYTKGKDGQLYYENFGFIPFFRLDNCRKQLAS